VRRLVGVRRVVDEVGVVDPAGQGGGVSVVDQLQVVDPGHRLGLVGVGGVGSGGGVDVAADPVRDRGADVAALVAHRDVGEVEGARHEGTHVAPGQRSDPSRNRLESHHFSSCR